MNYSASIEVSAPPEKVFPLVADPKSRQDWMQKGFGARYTQFSTEYPNGFDEAHAVGTKFVDVAKRTSGNLEAHYVGEILRYAKPSLFEFRTEVPFNASSQGKTESAVRTVTVVTFQLTPSGSGTKVAWSMKDEAGSSFGLLNWPVVTLVQGLMGQALKKLKIMAEG